MKIKVIDEFKSFAMRGNVIDLAVGIIIGGAFGKIVSSLVADVLMPPIGLMIGGVNFADLKITIKAAASSAAGVVTPAVTINYGVFIQTMIDFVLIAIAVFIMIKVINNLNRKKEATAPAAPETPPADIQLLTEIRDLLKK